MYLVSSCLAGVSCRYDGAHSQQEKVMELVENGQAVLICPEQLGGLPTPRACCEIHKGEHGKKKVITQDGRDFTREFTLGAQKSLAIAKAFGIKKAILKAKSPSCGCGSIYDGTFSRKLVEGNGLLVELLLNYGFEIMTEEDL